MYNWNSDPTVSNCTFVGNESFDVSGGGGGIRNEVGSSPTVINCTFSANTATVGAGMRSNSGCTPTVVNSVFWGNVPDEINDIDSSYTTVNYSDVQGGWLFGGGIGNVNSDPLFIDSDGPDGTSGTEDDDLRLSVGSPCIDAGENSSVTVPTDLVDNPRIVDGNADDAAVVDMGSYEFQIPRIQVVIDIKPGSDPNSINLGSHGVIPVAVLTSYDFDATTVDPDTVELAGSSVALRGNGSRLLASFDDVDGDGDMDLVLQIETENLTLKTGATEATLRGQTFEGQEIIGIDTIVVVNE